MAINERTIRRIIREEAARVIAEEEGADRCSSGGDFYESRRRRGSLVEGRAIRQMVRAETLRILRESSDDEPEYDKPYKGPYPKLVGAVVPNEFDLEFAEEFGGGEGPKTAHQAKRALLGLSREWNRVDDLGEDLEDIRPEFDEIFGEENYSLSRNKLDPRRIDVTLYDYPGEYGGGELPYEAFWEPDKGWTEN